MAKATKDNKDRELHVKIVMRNENIMTGTTHMKALDFETPYGNLNIPVMDISMIELGIIADRSQEKNIDNLINLLAETSGNECKNIYYKLISLNESAIPLIQEYINSNLYKPSSDNDFNAENALAELKGKFHVKDDYLDKDVISLHGDYKIPGEYKFESVFLKTEFGDLNIPKNKISSVEMLHPTTAGNVKSFKLNANLHISGNANGGWLKTGINLKAGQKFSVHTSGEVVLASLSNQKHKADGSYLPTGGSWTMGNDNDPNAYPIYGNVVYKIGENGPVMKAGTKYSGTAATNGMLYLSIYETVFNAGNTGSYNVNVSLK